MKSKFMRMVGSGIEDENEEEPQVFQEYEEQPTGEVFQEYEEEPIEEEKTLPLISDGDIDALYNKFKELGFQSDATDKREYVLDAYIKMETFLSSSFPQNIEGGGKVEDLEKILLEKKNVLNEKEASKKKASKNIINLEDSDINLSEIEKIPNQLDNEIRDLTLEIEELKIQIDKEKALKENEKEKQNFRNEIDFIYQKRITIENYRNEISKIKATNKLNKETKGKYIKKINDRIIELTNQINSKIIELESLGLSKRQIENLIDNFNVDIETNINRPLNVIIDKQTYPLNLNYEGRKNIYKSLTAEKILNTIKEIKDATKVSIYVDDLFTALSNMGIIKGDTSGVNEKEEIKKQMILVQFDYPLSGKMALNEYGEIGLNDITFQEAMEQRRNLKSKIITLFPKIKQYAVKQNWYQGFFTEFTEAKFLGDEMASYMYPFYKTKLLQNGISEDEFKRQFNYKLSDTINSMTLTYNSIFGDASPIDYIMPIKDKHGNKIFDILLETKSTAIKEKIQLIEETQPKDEDEDEKEDEKKDKEGYVYTTFPKLLNLLITAFKQDTKVAFCNFHYVRENYADTILNLSNKSCIPLKSNIIEMFQLFEKANFKAEYNDETETITLTDNNKDREGSYNTVSRFKYEPKRDDSGNIMYKKNGDTIPKKVNGNTVWLYQKNNKGENEKIKETVKIYKTNYKPVYKINKKNNELNSFFRYFYKDAIITGGENLYFNCDYFSGDLSYKFKYEEVEKNIEERKIAQLSKPKTSLDVKQSKSNVKAPSIKTKIVEDEESEGFSKVVADKKVKNVKQDKEDEEDENTQIEIFRQVLINKKRYDLKNKYYFTNNNYKKSLKDELIKVMNVYNNKNKLPPKPKITTEH